MIDVSMIVPVYNVENVLRQCVDSLCADTLQGNYEIILVDDGSTDHSGEICDLYAGKKICTYARGSVQITVVHQQNAGLSAARNRGMLHAAGEYLLFVDADDYLAEDALVRLEHEIKDRADLYILKMQKVFPDGTVRLIDQIDDKRLKGQEKADCIRYLAGLAKYPGSACAKLVKRELVLRHRLLFEEGVTAEDLVWTLQCMLYADTFRYLDFPFYYYRQSRDGSITSKITLKGFLDLHHALQSAAALAEKEMFLIYKKEIYSMMAYEVQILLLLYGGLEKAAWPRPAGRQELGENQKLPEYAAILKKECRLLKYRHDKRTMGIRWLVKLLGVRCGSLVLYQVWRWREI